jgi:hypothetical protein
MNRPKIAAALKTALESGVAESPLHNVDDPRSDFALITKDTSVGTTTDPQAPTKLAEVMADDPAFAELKDKYVLGGLVSGQVNLTHIAQAMLAQALKTGDIDRVVADMANVIATNQSDVMVVMALLGVKVDLETQMGPEVCLVPLSSLPPSLARGQALGQATFPGVMALSQASRQPASAALITKQTMSPLFGTSQELAAGGQRYLKALGTLVEARDCLNLIGLCAPLTHSTWEHILPPAMYLTGQSSWATGEQPLPLVEAVDIDANEVNQLGAKYFAWSESDRNSALRVPLSRLARAVRQRGRNLVDQAIDLGIALEALLLHESGGGELRFQLGLRGAWLGGRDADSRRELFLFLRKIYDLRSNAVHRGDIDRSQTTAEALQKGLTVCANLIRRAIDRGEIISNWPAILTGAGIPEVPGETSDN